MSGAVISDQLAELNAELLSQIDKFKALIGNRSAWADGVEGCREGAVMVSHAQRRLLSILEEARNVESDLASARAELERWSKMHAELATVERDLRADRDRYRAMHADLLVVERELRTGCDQKQAMIEGQASSLSNARALALEMVREIGS